MTSVSGIRSLLVANRGEIAVRVFRTCRRLGIRTVAVYSDADAGALHVREADEAVHIGPAPARQSYLDMGAVIGAALASGVDAIHPGYGFLSENAAFAQRCADAGLLFVGPSPRAIAAMGSKIEAKRLAEAAGVPTVPGYHGDDDSPERIVAEAARIGYPVLIKASAGGGGRGMRRVDTPEDMTSALEAARQEALSAFGDERVLVEKLILRPRHLEVQLAGDRHGTLLHLGERDCSVQRNNQKVLEETPAPHLDPAVREGMLQAALTLGRAIGYDSAGTVEFVMDAQDGQPYFLEMNTRLQVEHAVTEMVTGIDLVYWQLLASAGEHLPVTQEQIAFRGHAIEARVTAERADLQFQPSHGTVAAFAAPRGIRIDSGVADGSHVGLHYDSLLAKVIAHGRTREDALARLDAGLGALSILGLPTTQPFLRDAVRHPLFSEGRATTGFIGEAFPDGWQPAAGELGELRTCAAAAWLRIGEVPAAEAWLSPWAARGGQRVMSDVRPATVSLVATDEYGTVPVEIRVAQGKVDALVDGEQIALGRVGFDGAQTIHAGTEHEERLAVVLNDGRVMLSRAGLSLSAQVSPRIALSGGPEDVAEAADETTIRAPLPGLVTKVVAPVGTLVEKGAVVLQLETMKLVYSLTAGVAGTVGVIHVEPGATVAAGAVLAEIRPKASGEGG